MACNSLALQWSAVQTTCSLCVAKSSWTCVREMRYVPPQAVPRPAAPSASGQSPGHTNHHSCKFPHTDARKRSTSLAIPIDCHRDSDLQDTFLWLEWPSGVVESPEWLIALESYLQTCKDCGVAFKQFGHSAGGGVSMPPTSGSGRTNLQVRYTRVPLQQLRCELHSWSPPCAFWFVCVAASQIYRDTLRLIKHIAGARVSNGDRRILGQRQRGCRLVTNRLPPRAPVVSCLRRAPRPPRSRRWRPSNFARTRA